MRPGDRYLFRIDGRDVPDPASRRQPSGVDGPSEIVDHGCFAWHDQDWRGHAWHEAIIYELHVGTFSSSGTFCGAIDHLDHLVSLGGAVVEIMPVAAFSGDRNWGHDGVFAFAPCSTYGSPDDLKRLVDACHRRGLSIVFDVVFNPPVDRLPDSSPIAMPRRGEG